MSKTTNILTDTFGRQHNYLRISLSEKCNLRCTYCMPANGVPLTPRPELMTAQEIFDIAKVFVKNGVDKIRLTGGEPLVRKDFTEILKMLSTLPVALSITTNAILAPRFIADFKRYGLNKINVSLDTLDAEKFKKMTRRDRLEETLKSIKQLIAEGFRIKINTVLIKGTNDDEIVNLINLTKHDQVAIRFIEFMPFDGNAWNKDKLVTQAEILNVVHESFGIDQVKNLVNESNFTSRNYQVSGYKGVFGIISSMSNPFCDGCNRIRLTANGRIKNCLFSSGETDILTPFREGDNLEVLIQQALSKKKNIRAGMDDFEKLSDPKRHSANRSMITIGG
ncbi:MAG: GTP 3',8-cyclase MoaA [Leeuwenhoekiella sp.]